MFLRCRLAFHRQKKRAANFCSSMQLECGVSSAIERGRDAPDPPRPRLISGAAPSQDRKSTRLNSSHRCTSYAVFCLKKKNTNTPLIPHFHRDSHHHPIHNVSSPSIPYFVAGLAPRPATDIYDQHNLNDIIPTDPLTT